MPRPFPMFGRGPEALAMDRLEWSKPLWWQRFQALLYHLNWLQQFEKKNVQKDDKPANKLNHLEDRVERSEAGRAWQWWGRLRSYFWNYICKFLYGITVCGWRHGFGGPCQEPQGGQQIWWRCWHFTQAGRRSSWGGSSKPQQSFEANSIEKSPTSWRWSSTIIYGKCFRCKSSPRWWCEGSHGCFRWFAGRWRWWFGTTSTTAWSSPPWAVPSGGWVDQDRDAKACGDGSFVQRRGRRLHGRREAEHLICYGLALERQQMATPGTIGGQGLCLE